VHCQGAVPGDRGHDPWPPPAPVGEYPDPEVPAFAGAAQRTPGAPRQREVQEGDGVGRAQPDVEHVVGAEVAVQIDHRQTGDHSDAPGQRGLAGAAPPEHHEPLDHSSLGATFGSEVAGGLAGTAGSAVTVGSAVTIGSGPSFGVGVPRPPANGGASGSSGFVPPAARSLLRVLTGLLQREIGEFLGLVGDSHAPIVAPVQDGWVGEMPDQVRRRLDEVFGDVLPSTTSDERDDDGSRRPDSGDEQLLADRPPHHDRE
jgi:hypothetical protein